MNDETNPKEKNPMIAICWLVVGLAPIPILLSVMSSNGAHPSWINPIYLFLFCALLNLIGGIGCLTDVKDSGTRMGFGILLGIFFFLLTWGIVLFQACSHMNI
jgi:hypothetical protein